MTEGGKQPSRREIKPRQRFGKLEKLKRWFEILSDLHQEAFKQHDQKAKLNEKLRCFADLHYRRQRRRGSESVERKERRERDEELVSN